MTFPSDLDIFRPFIVQCPWTKICRGSDIFAAIRNAGQKMQWNLGWALTENRRTWQCLCLWRGHQPAIVLLLRRCLNPFLCWVGRSSRFPGSAKDIQWPSSNSPKHQTRHRSSVQDHPVPRFPSLIALGVWRYLNPLAVPATYSSHPDNIFLVWCFQEAGCNVLAAALGDLIAWNNNSLRTSTRLLNRSLWRLWRVNQWDPVDLQLVIPYRSIRQLQSTIPRECPCICTLFAEVLSTPSVPIQPPRTQRCWTASLCLSSVVRIKICSLKFILVANSWMNHCYVKDYHEFLSSWCAERKRIFPFRQGCLLYLNQYGRLIPKPSFRAHQCLSIVMSTFSTTICTVYVHLQRPLNACVRHEGLLLATPSVVNTSIDIEYRRRDEVLSMILQVSPFSLDRDHFFCFFPCDWVIRLSSRGGCWSDWRDCTVQSLCLLS